MNSMAPLACFDKAEFGIVSVGDFELGGGEILRDTQVAWQSSGQLSSSRPVVLLLHGYTNSHVFWAKDPPVDLTSGWGNQLVGPGQAIDTNRCVALSFNHLGSCYGTTGPRSSNPKTGQPYGLSFPKITIVDQAQVITLALGKIGIKRLKAIVGYSYGGYLAFQLTLNSTVPCDRVAILASAPRGHGSATELTALKCLASIPSQRTLYDRRLATLQDYGLNITEPKVRKSASDWSRTHDATSLLRLREAAMGFDISNDISSLDKSIFLVRARDDPLFPALMGGAEEHGLPAATYQVILASGGHLAPVRNPDTYAADLSAFLTL